jgi:ATP-dependent DNA helicase PIF1
MEKRVDKLFLYFIKNHLNFSDIPNYLLTLYLAEEMVIARVYVAINVFIVRGQQYKYRGHVIHFLRNVGKVYNKPPLLPKDLDIVILRPVSSTSNPAIDRQRFRIRRRVVKCWLTFLAQNHPGYNDFQLN